MPSGIYTRKTPPPCSFPGCGRAHDSGGLCNAHCQQIRRGKPLSSIRMLRPKFSPPRIICDEEPCLYPHLVGPCHVFRGCKNTGYGLVAANGRNIAVHRYVWEKENGPIPDGMVIDHQCRNRGCCNVDHLRVVTHHVNLTENSIGFAAINAAKTHCIRGHPFDEANTFKNSFGKRVCLACRRKRPTCE